MPLSLDEFDGQAAPVIATFRGHEVRATYAVADATADWYALTGMHAELLAPVLLTLDVTVKGKPVGPPADAPKEVRITAWRELLGAMPQALVQAVLVAVYEDLRPGKSLTSSSSAPSSGSFA